MFCNLSKLILKETTLHSNSHTLYTPAVVNYACVKFKLNYIH